MCVCVCVFIVWVCVCVLLLVCLCFSAWCVLGAHAGAGQLVASSHLPTPMYMSIASLGEPAFMKYCSAN